MISDVIHDYDIKNGAFSCALSYLGRNLYIPTGGFLWHHQIQSKFCSFKLLPCCGLDFRWDFFFLWRAFFDVKKVYLCNSFQKLWTSCKAQKRWWTSLRTWRDRDHPFASNCVGNTPLLCCCWSVATHFCHKFFYVSYKLCWHFVTFDIVRPPLFHTWLTFATLTSMAGTSTLTGPTHWDGPWCFPQSLWSHCGQLDRCVGQKEPLNRSLPHYFTIKAFFDI